MTEQSKEELDRLSSKLTIAEMETLLPKLSQWLGECHADMHILLSWMERAQGNIPTELREFIKETRQRLTLRQNAFLKEFGDKEE
jgi:hypothetical protein